MDKIDAGCLYSGSLIEVEWAHLGRFGTEEYETNALKWGWHSVVPGVLTSVADMGFGDLDPDEYPSRDDYYRREMIRVWERLARIGVDETGGEAIIITRWSHDRNFVEFCTISDFAGFSAVYDVEEDALDELGIIEEGVYLTADQQEQRDEDV